MLSEEALFAPLFNTILSQFETPTTLAQHIEEYPQCMKPFLAARYDRLLLTTDLVELNKLYGTSSTLIDSVVAMKFARALANKSITEIVDFVANYSVSSGLCVLVLAAFCEKLPAYLRTEQDGEKVHELYKRCTFVLQTAILAALNDPPRKLQRP